MTNVIVYYVPTSQFNDFKIKSSFEFLTMEEISQLDTQDIVWISEDLNLGKPKSVVVYGFRKKVIQNCISSDGILHFEFTDGTKQDCELKSQNFILNKRKPECIQTLKELCRGRKYENAFSKIQ